MKSAFSVLFSLIVSSPLSQASMPLRCESDDILLTFNMADTQTLDTYVFSQKTVPQTKLEIAAPKSIGNGIIDVSAPDTTTETYLQLPPYAAREDVTQFILTYSSDNRNDETSHFEEDILCVKLTAFIY